MSSKKAVMGLVSSEGHAESVVGELRRGGFAPQDISVLLPDARSTHDFAIEQNTKAPEGAIAGVGAGGVLGGAFGLLVGLGALVIPGFGPFFAAGPILVALSGAAAGAAVGGLTGALLGLGIPELEAKQYEGKIRGGHILISAHLENAGDRGRARRILERCGVTHLVTIGEQPVPPIHGARHPHA